MKKLFPLLLLCVLSISCKDEIRRKIPKTPAEEAVAKDPMAVMLPVHMDSTNYLLHPVGVWERDSQGYFSSGSSSGMSAYASSDGLRGRMTNIFFQELNGEDFVPLTDKSVLITSGVFLRGIFENTGKGFLLYTVYDRDSNGDEELDDDDIKSLYISGINGKNFKKITAEDQDFLELSLINIMNRIYFRSYEDLNADGSFGKEDKVHLFYIDLSATAPEVVEYDPQKGQS